MTVRALVIALVLLVLANIWMKYAELVTISSQVTMSVPPIPVLIGLIVLLAIRPLGKLLALSRRELLFVYVFLTLSVALTSGGALREFLPQLTVMRYFATPENGWEALQAYQPAWMAPQDPEVIRGFYEGSDGGRVPWGAWVGPLSSWSVLFLLLLGTTLCLSLLFYDEWADREKLAFPVTELPLAMTAPQDLAHRIPPFWRDPVMWIGFGLAALHNGLNIAHAFNPSVPALGFSYSFAGLFPERPLSALQDVTIYHRPEVLGFAYLMPQDVVVSSLLFYAVLLVEGVGALAMGYDIPRFPFFESQAAGAFVSFAIILLIMARHHLGHCLRGAVTRQGKPVETWAVWGLVIGLLGIFVWWRIAGMAITTILLYFGILLLMALTYARIRAQAGLPEMWAYPVSQANIMLIALFGSDMLKRAGGAQNLTVFYTGFFLTRGYLPNLSAYQMEGLHIGEQGGLSRRETATTLVLAMIAGMAISYIVQLQAAYGYGMNFLEGGTHGGGMRVADSRGAYQLLSDAVKRGTLPVRGEALAIGWGALVTVAMTILRYRLPRFPLNHLGFIIGTTRGYRTWGGLLFAAIIKAAAVRMGGVALYRRLIPGAIGLILGHFVLAGGVWSIAALFGGDISRQYQVWFG